MFKVALLELIGQRIRHRQQSTLHTRHNCIEREVNRLSTLLLPVSTIVYQVNFHDCSHPAHHVLSRLESTIKLKDRPNLIIQQALEIVIYQRKIQVEETTLRLHAAEA